MPCADLLARLVGAREVRTDEPDLIRSALMQTRGGAEFADAVIAQLGQLAGCAHTVTFDRRAGRLSGMKMLD